MNKFTFINGLKMSDLLLKQNKFIIGNDYSRIRSLYRLFVEAQKNFEISEYQSETKIVHNILINECVISSKKEELIILGDNYSLENDFKLQSKSFVLKYLQKELAKTDYCDSFYTISELMNSICLQFNEESKINISAAEFSSFDFCKYIRPTLLIEGMQANEFDLNECEYLRLQMEMIDGIYADIDKAIYIIFKVSSLTKEILEMINSFNCIRKIVFCDEVCSLENLEDVYLVNHDLNLDLANEQEVYEKICCDILNNSNIEEGYKYMRKHIEKTFKNRNCPDFT